MEIVAVKGDKTFAFAFKEKISLDSLVTAKDSATYKLLTSDALLIKDGTKYKIVNIKNILTSSTLPAAKEVEASTTSIGTLTASLFNAGVTIQSVKQISDNEFIVVTDSGTGTKPAAVSKLVLNMAHDNILEFKEIIGTGTFASIAQVLVAKTGAGANVLVIGDDGANAVAKTFDVTKNVFKDIVITNFALGTSLKIGGGFAYEVEKDTYLVPKKVSGMAKIIFSAGT